MKDFVKNIWIKYNIKSILTYLIVGFITTIVNLLVYFVATNLFLDPSNALELQIANVLAWIIAVLFAYFANRKFVFKSNNKNKLNEAFKFYLGRVSTLLLEMLLMFLMVSIMSINDKISKLVVQILVIISNYIISRFLVFTEKNGR